jgi:hypothetical protein
MRPRDKAGGKAAKPQRPKTLKGHNKTARVRSSRVARKETNVARLTRERDEALEQRTATAEILKHLCLAGETTSVSPDAIEPR